MAASIADRIEQKYYFVPLSYIKNAHMLYSRTITFELAEMTFILILADKVTSRIQARLVVGSYLLVLKANSLLRKVNIRYKSYLNVRAFVGYITIVICIAILNVIKYIIHT